ncbi:nuclear protein localization protein 4 homolog isoform X2 [Ctenocephalides felis]|nr:nuclear protein localization protein 4 homolog isoform X2 [Ctenocephalides felis]
MKYYINIKMSKYNKSMVLRVQTSEGTKRLDVKPNDTTSQLFEKIHDLFELSGFAFALYREKNNQKEIISSKSRTLTSYDLKHGDMLYLTPINGAKIFSQTTLSNAKENNTPFGEPIHEPSTSSSSSQNLNHAPVEDDVDIQLTKIDGRIERGRDDKLCRHNSNGCCVHCSPIEPWDEAYLKEHKIKHMSFHSFMRKMTSGVDRGKFLAMDDISCSIKVGCREHPPWPKGICSKCQPSALTLNRQTYRHVDNVMFENAAIVERFLNYWRSTGHQRIGLLYGMYEMHNDVPLGIRARVVAIYEPPQESTRDSVTLYPDSKAEDLKILAQQLGLTAVGWIFTDLIAEDASKGTVKHVRGIDSHFLSAQECIMAGYFQNAHPNVCKHASNNYFGSKFVTVCITGDKSNQVHMEGYSVSNQCMALVRDNCLIPTKDAPELGYVRESSDKQYVPDVYYKEKDCYGNEVLRLARPLPVEYLLVDVPTSTPLVPQFTFNTLPDKIEFPIENRMLDGHLQDFNAIVQYFNQFTTNEFLEAMSDFHLLLYITTMDMLPLGSCIGPLLTAIRTNNRQLAQEWSTSEHWATMEQLIAASGNSPPNSRPSSMTGGPTSASANAGTGPVTAGDVGRPWTCPHCTYINPADMAACDMCSLPR